ncbi:MAG: hypothetical protein IT307_08850 [Chloroflexi bacterium]|nr:hypothetical protein [Chloroflexota bacterium]
MRVEEVQRPGGASDELQQVFMPFSLTVGDGFKFGCGLSIALGTALLIGVLTLLIITLAGSLAGVPTPFTPR